MARKKKKNWIYAVGRRRSANARVRLFRGKGENQVNGMRAAEYFPGLVASKAFNKPFDLTGTSEKYYVTIKVIGGGKKGQLGAVVHGIARTLAQANVEKFRPSLKAAGLLTRDDRTRERRKVGTGGKARRKKQSPKR